MNDAAHYLKFFYIKFNSQKVFHFQFKTFVIDQMFLFEKFHTEITEHIIYRIHIYYMFTLQQFWHYIIKNLTWDTILYFVKFECYSLNI